MIARVRVGDVSARNADTDKRRRTNIERDMFRTARTIPRHSAPATPSEVTPSRFDTPAETAEIRGLAPRIFLHDPIRL